MENNRSPSKRADEIYHWGIKGMKWGIRRYQNEDGTLTEEGQKRYNRDTAGMSEKNKKKYVADADTWVNEDIRNTKSAIDNASSLAKQFKDSSDVRMRSAPKTKMDLSNMSDKELRDAVNRYNLEQQYINSFAPSTVSKGEIIVNKIMEGLRETLQTAGTAAALILSIRTILGKGKL